MFFIQRVLYIISDSQATEFFAKSLKKYFFKNYFIELNSFKVKYKDIFCNQQILRIVWTVFESELKFSANFLW